MCRILHIKYYKNASIISAITTSVNANNGYYISRYEAGTTTQRTSAEQALTPALSKATSVGTPVYAYGIVTWNQAISLAGGLYNKAQHNVQSRLINNRGWDTALKFIEQVDSSFPIDSRDKGWHLHDFSAGNPFYETEKPQGASTNMIRNIYDMGGNMSEWTADLLTSNGSHAVRGGSGNVPSATYPVADRNNYYSPGTTGALGFRLVLYL